jgi:hypothetical protein
MVPRQTPRGQVDSNNTHSPTGRIVNLWLGWLLISAYPVESNSLFLLTLGIPTRGTTSCCVRLRMSMLERP